MFNFAWLTAPGTAVFVAALLSMVLLRMNRRADRRRRSGGPVVQMKIPIPTIAFMLGLSYVTRYAGMDATLGSPSPAPGVLYPFFAAILGWLGVFLTGTDAGSNALFGSLQKITATQIHQAGGVRRSSSLRPGAGADLHGQQHRRRHGQDDRRPEHLRGHGGDATSSARRPTSSRRSSGTASCWRRSSALMTLLQAYVLPFTLMVPHVP